MLLLEPILHVTAAVVGAGMYETNEVAFSLLMYVLSVNCRAWQFVLIVAMSSKYTAAVHEWPATRPSVPMLLHRYVSPNFVHVWRSVASRLTIFPSLGEIPISSVVFWSNHVDLWSL